MIGFANDPPFDSLSNLYSCSLSQGWLTEDQSVILLDDELDEFYAPDDDK